MNTSQNMYLEHANITVNNLDESIRFFKTAFPEFEIRGGGTSDDRKWVHLGTAESYLALNEGTKADPNERYSDTGINHLGFVVKDVNAIAKRLQEAGFERSYPRQDQTFRIREYFDDADGFQYEFVQYLSDKIEERNSYSD